MGLIEYVPARITFDTLIYATAPTADAPNAVAARALHAASPNTMGLYIAINSADTDLGTMFITVVKQYNRALHVVHDAERAGRVVDTPIGKRMFVGVGCASAAAGSATS